MLRKVKIFLGRVKTMNFKKMFRMIEQIHTEHHKSRIVTFIDMVYCALKYGIGYQDYRVFGFAIVKGKNRDTFMTMNHNLSLVRQLNNRQSFDVFDNKIKFFNTFRNFITREWINLEKCSMVEFEDFCKNKEKIFAKQVKTFGGQGVEMIELTPETDYDKLYVDLLNNKQYLVEELIVQHNKLNELYPTSLNTLRMVTVVKDNVPYLISSLIRMGQRGSTIDNITSGGMYAPINGNGVITHSAFCDREGTWYPHHPDTGTAFIGFQIPYYKEAVQLVKSAALVVSDMRYIGWDVAITPEGPVLVEGNNFPSYEIMQNYKHRDNNEGIKIKVQNTLGIEL